VTLSTHNVCIPTGGTGTMSEVEPRQQPTGRSLSGPERVHSMDKIPTKFWRLTGEEHLKVGNWAAGARFAHNSWKPKGTGKKEKRGGSKRWEDESL